jgi:mannose-6-phosphate isomerase-like protein (cupin superfamily)
MDAPGTASADERMFAAHEVLRGFLPTNGVSFKWVTAVEGNARPAQRVERRTMFLVLTGGAHLSGDVNRAVVAGDVVTVPEGSHVGFEGVHAQGLSLLEIMLPGAEAPSRTLADVHALVESRAATARRGPFFALLRDGALSEPARRERFFACLQVISDAFQTVLSTRQATCRDARFLESFRNHFLEELGHNDLLSQRDGRTKTETDPVLTATATWFCRQMLVLDNLDKAVLVHLVLETAGADFHVLAREAFSGGSTDTYFSAHSELDTAHKEVPRELLEGHDPETYRRLYALLEDGWDMFDAMGARIAAIVKRKDPT